MLEFSLCAYLSCIEVIVVWLCANPSCVEVIVVWLCAYPSCVEVVLFERGVVEKHLEGGE